MYSLQFLKKYNKQITNASHSEISLIKKKEEWKQLQKFIGQMKQMLKAKLRDVVDIKRITNPIVRISVREIKIQIIK